MSIVFCEKSSKINHYSHLKKINFISSAILHLFYSTRIKFDVQHLSIYRGSLELQYEKKKFKWSNKDIFVTTKSIHTEDIYRHHYIIR